MLPIVNIHCTKCDKSLVADDAYVDKDGIIVKCKHCNHHVDLEKFRNEKFFSETIKNRQLKLKL